MSPILALCLCLTFCFVVLYKKSNLEQDIAWSVWLPTLWMMRCASRGLSLWFISRDSAVAADMDLTGSVYDQLFFGTLMLIGSALLWQRRDRCSALFRSNLFLFTFFVYMGISVGWSDDSASFKRWIRAGGDLTMALLVITEAKPLQAMITVFKRTAYLLIPLSVVLIKYFPDLGRMQSKHWGPDMWIGVTTHKNPLGQLCLFAGIVLLLDIFQRWREKSQILRLPFLSTRIDVLYGIMVLYLLAGDGHSKSTTSFLVLLFACGLFLLLERKHSRGRRIVLARLGFGFLLIGLLVHLSFPLLFDRSLREFVAESQGKDPTLAGRTQLWSDLMTMGTRHPLFGAGYSGFWTRTNRAELDQRHPWGPTQAHNGYIELWLQLGFVGLLLFVLVLGQTFRGISSRLQTDFEYGNFRLVLLAVTLVHNYSEAGFPRPTHLVWFVFLLAVINVQPVQTVLVEKVSAPADVAGQLGRQRRLSFRQSPYLKDVQAKHSQSTDPELIISVERDNQE